MAVTKFLGVRYSRDWEPDLRLDIWQRDDIVEWRPAVLFFHGGGFVGGTRDDTKYDLLANAIVDHGITWVSADYGFAPDTLMPTTFQQGFGALRWLRAHNAGYKLTSNKVVVAGGSAGGIMATQMFAMQTEGPTGSFGGNLSQSNSSRGLMTVSAAIYNPDLNNVSAAVKTAFNDTFGCADYTASCSNAVSYLPQSHYVNIPAGKKALLLHGAQDTDFPVIHATNTEAALDAAGVAADLIVNANKGHGITNANAQLPAILSWLDAVFV